MYLKKSIVLIGLVAVTAAPTAGARFLPDPGDSGNALQPVPIGHRSCTRRSHCRSSVCGSSRCGRTAWHSASSRCTRASGSPRMGEPDAIRLPRLGARGVGGGMEDACALSRPVGIQRQEAEMYLRKTIVLVALAALAAAPSGLAYWAPEEPDPRIDHRAAPARRLPGEADEAGEAEGEEGHSAGVLHAVGPVLLREVAPGGSLGASGSPDSGEPDAVRSR